MLPILLNGEDMNTWQIVTLVIANVADLAILAWVIMAIYMLFDDNDLEFTEEDFEERMKKC